MSLPNETALLSYNVEEVRHLVWTSVVCLSSVRIWVISLFAGVYSEIRAMCGGFRVTYISVY